MGFFDEFQAKQQGYQGSSPISPEEDAALSLLRKKKDFLASRAMEKSEYLNPGATDFSLAGSGVGRDYVDLAQSSLYRTLGNLKDLGGDALNYIPKKMFDTELINTDPNQGWSDMNTADAAAGYTERDALNARQNLVLQNAGKLLSGEGSFMETAESAADTGFETVLNSLGTMATMAIPGSGAVKAVGAVTKVGKLADMARDAYTGGKAVKAATAAKGANVADKVEDTGDAILKGAAATGKTAEVTKELEKGSRSAIALKNALSATGKAADRTALMTAELVQIQRNEYKAEHGEEPSVLRLVGITLMTSATSMIELFAMGKFFIPRGMRAAPVRGVDGELIADPTKVQKFVSELKRMAEHADKSTIRNIAGRVVSGAGKIGAAGSAEAAQEYLQTWGEILGQKVGVDEAMSMFESIAKEITDSGNQAEALAGAFLGASAGVHTRGVITAPTTAALAASDVVTGTLDSAAKFATKRAEAALTTQQRQDNADKAAVRSEQLKEMRDNVESNMEALDGIKTFNEIDADANPTLAADMAKLLTGKDANDPVEFGNARKQLNLIYKGDLASLYTQNVVKAIADPAKQVGKNILYGTADLLDITPERVDAAIEKSKTLGKAVYEDLKDYKNSYPAAIIEVAVEAATTQSAASIKKLKEVTQEYTPDAIGAMITILEKSGAKDSDTVKALRAQMRRKVAANSRLGMDKKEPILKGNLASSIAVVAAGGKLPKSTSINTLALDLVGVTVGNVQTLDVAETIGAAIDVYTNHVATTGKGTKLDGQIQRLKVSNDKKIAELKKEAEAKKDSNIINLEEGGVAAEVVETLKGWGNVALDFVDDIAAKIVEGKPIFKSKPDITVSKKTYERISFFGAKMRPEEDVNFEYTEEQLAENAMALLNEMISYKKSTSKQVLKWFKDDLKDQYSVEQVIAILAASVPGMITEDTIDAYKALFDWADNTKGFKKPKKIVKKAEKAKPAAKSETKPETKPETKSEVDTKAKTEEDVTNTESKATGKLVQDPDEGSYIDEESDEAKQLADSSELLNRIDCKKGAK